MPFFCYKGKMFCYLWVHKKLQKPYIGIVEGKHIEHPELIMEKRSRTKIILFDAHQDLPKETISNLINQAINLYKTRVVKSFRLIILFSIITFMADCQPKNVILCIGDGFGIAPKTATRMALGQGTDGKRYGSDAEFKILALDKLRYQATATTHSMNSWITDSAPGAEYHFQCQFL